MKNTKEEILQVTTSPLGELRLFTVYQDAHSINACGILTTTVHGETKSCLNTNYQLNFVFSTIEMGIWVVDDVGHVYTNANVKFTETQPSISLIFNNGYSQQEWIVSEIHKGQLNGIWGLSHSDLWITSYSGIAYHWNGKSWDKYNIFEFPTAIDGNGSDDVYIVGHNNNVYHWDGISWTKLNLPNNMRDNEVYTGIRAISKEQVIICGRGGCLLIGNAKDNFIDIGSSSFSWYGIGYFQNRIFLAGGDGGIFEYINNQLICINSKFSIVGVSEAENSITFFPANQEPTAWFIRYSPGTKTEWIRVNT